MTTAERQLVLFCDGTNNNLTGGARDTNVVKLCELLTGAPDADRLVFYDPGVGNPAELPGATIVDGWNRWYERLEGLAFGRGVYENIAESYLFLMRHYRAGDALFIFGFSRGAFTARSVAGLVNQFGILEPHLESMVHTLIHVYFSDRRLAPEAAAAVARQAARLFVPPAARNVEIEFVGVWDTVASVGMWPFSARITALPTVAGKRFRHVRQALALDEHRAQFEPRVYAEANGNYRTVNGHPVTLEQRWFRGAHCDLGGGCARGDAGLSNRALAWLVAEAVRCGLRLHAGQDLLDTEDAVLAAIAQPEPPAPDLVHSQLHTTCMWAVTGLSVRDTQRIALDNGEEHVVQAVEHPSVAQVALQYPQHTVWARKRARAGFWGCLLLVPLLCLVLGQLLAPQPASAAGWQDLQSWPQQAWAWQQQNLRFAQWQLLWWHDDGIGAGLAAFRAPRWAVLWDLALIAAYSYLLAWLAVAGFARQAGLRRAGDPPRPWLNRLGWALPLAVVADITEDIATWGVITLLDNQLILLATLAGCVMSLGAVAKFTGLAGVLVVCCLPTRR